MSEYWHNRYLLALAKIDEAQSVQARSAYIDLAAHYRAMRQFCDRSPVGGYRSAA